ncbi:hypothetical protein D3C85_1290620 [compost metagenome]
MPPDDTTKLASHPAIQLLKWSFALTELEVASPTSHYGVYPLDDVRYLVAPYSAQQLSESVAQATQTHRCHFQPRLFVPAHPIAQVITGPRPCHTALFPVHRQFKTLIQEALNTGHDPFACTMTAYINVRIVGIAHEAMAPPFKFAVEFVKQDVRQ